MKKGWNYYMSIVFVAAFIAAANTYSQPIEINAKSKRNAVSFIQGAHNFYDGNGIFVRRRGTLGGYRPFSKGIEYQRVLNKNWRLTGSVRVVTHAYWTPRNSGDITGRGVTIWEANLLLRLVTWKGISVYGLGGLSFRHGDETVFIFNFRGSILNDFYKLRDPGVTVGFRGQYEFPREFSIPVVKNLTVAAEAKFTQILWRFNSADSNRNFYPNRSTTQMLTVQLGLGYRF